MGSSGSIVVYKPIAREVQQKYLVTMKKVTKLGSKWDNGANAGTFYWNLNNSASNRNRNISRQLVNARFSRGFPRLFQYILCIPELPRHRAKQKNKIGCIGRL